MIKKIETLSDLQQYNSLSNEELNQILILHKKWLNHKKGGKRAILTGETFDFVDLRFADLRKASIEYCSFQNSSLDYANFSETDLRNNSFSGSSMTHTLFCDSNLENTYLNCCNLIDSNLVGSDLSDVTFKYSDLSFADLQNATIKNTNFENANIGAAYFPSNEKYRTGIVVEDPIKGYKKLANGSVCTLLIPKGAIVFCINGLKCRTNIATVLEGGGASLFDKQFIYRKGKTYTIDNFDTKYNVECSTGIHFFKTRKEAEDY